MMMATLLADMTLLTSTNFIETLENNDGGENYF